MPEIARAEIFRRLDPAAQQHLLSTDKELCRIFGQEIRTIEIRGEDIRAALRRFPLVEDVKLTGFVSLEEFQHFAEAVNIRSLDMSGVMNFTPELYHALRGMDSLNRLDSLVMPSVRVPAAQLADFVADSPEITDITITGHVTPQQLEVLGQAPGLRSLDLSECTGLTDEAVSALEGLSLNKLDLGGSPQLTNAALEPVGRIPSLESLNLTGCTGIHGEGLAHLIPLENLSVLNLSGCTGIGRFDISHLGNLVRLESLTLSNMTRYAYQGLANGESPLLRLPRLESLDFSGTGHPLLFVDDNLAVLEDIPSLRDLDIRDCDQITEQALEVLMTSRPELNIQGPAVVLQQPDG
jgi:hypothetical protein